MTMTIWQILMLRSEWELIVTTNRYDLPDYNGTLDTLKWFVANGYKKNRFRNQYNDAMSIAEQLLENEKCDTADTLNTSMMQA